MDDLQKECRDCGHKKPVSEFQKKLRGILGVMPYCIECRNIKRRSQYSSDDNFRANILEKQRIKNAENPQPNREKARQWAANNPDKAKFNKRQWDKDNKEKMLESKRLWDKNNPHMKNAATAKRNAAKLQAIPLWANSFFITEAYRLARLRPALTGISWEVDHIVPLQNSMVCGLHCEQNIQVITQKENRNKSNIYWPDMP